MSVAARRSAPVDTGRLSLERDGRDWPNRDASRFIEAGGMRWHFQRMGRGPTLLLLHGTGAATHSWRDLAPLLARDFDVIAIDLPGHGFTDPMRMGPPSLPGMARAIGAFLRALAVEPAFVVGHSAGAAILARMALDRLIAPEAMISLNGAFLPFEGLAGHLFPPIAKLLFLNPLAPRIFAWSADRATVGRLLRGTGSTIDAQGLELYARLFGNAAHVEAVLAMMAHWNLEQLGRDIGRLTTPVALIAAAGDKAVPPETAQAILARLPNASIERLRGVGHLAHEEQPARVASIVLSLTGQMTTVRV
jgi:magnesium chelatase accessory protein